MRGNVLGQAGGGAKINGIIEKYRVLRGNTVNAGDFVKFVEAEARDEDDIKLSDYGRYKTAVVLSENRVFIAYQSEGYLYGTIIIINNNQIIPTEIDVILSSSEYTRYALDSVALSENKIFIAYQTGYYGNDINGMICTVDENNAITVNTDMRVEGIYGSITSGAIGVIALNNKVFIGHTSSGSPYYFKGIVCTINEDNSITTGTDTYLSSTNQGLYNTLILPLNENKIFIIYGGSSSTIIGKICTVNEDNSITQVTTTAISSISGSVSNVAAVMLSENKIFITNSDSYDNKYKLRGIIITINDDVITKNTDVLLSSNDNSGQNLSAVLLSKNRVFIAHKNTDNKLYRIICTINEDNSITTGTDILASNIDNSGAGRTVSILLNETNILIIHSVSGNNLYGIINDVEIYAKTIESKNDKIEGVSTTKGRSGETVKITVPYFEEV